MIIIQEDVEMCKFISAKMHSMPVFFGESTGKKAAYGRKCKMIEEIFENGLTNGGNFAILAAIENTKMHRGFCEIAIWKETGCFMKRFLAAMVSWCLLAMPVMGLADEATAKNEHVVTTAISADPVTMDVSLNNVTPGNTVTGVLFSGLYKWDATGSQTVPCYAAGYTVSEDGLTYTFTMKDDIFFSDGTPMDASDVYYSYMHVLDPNTASTLTTDLWAIHNAKAYCTGEVTDPAQVGIKLIDEKTIEFTLDAPASWFISQGCVLAIVKEGIYEENPTWWKDPATYVCSCLLYTSVAGGAHVPAGSPAAKGTAKADGIRAVPYGYSSVEPDAKRGEAPADRLGRAEICTARGRLCRPADGGIRRMDGAVSQAASGIHAGRSAAALLPPAAEMRGYLGVYRAAAGGAVIARKAGGGAGRRAAGMRGA